MRGKARRLVEAEDNLKSPGWKEINNPQNTQITKDTKVKDPQTGQSMVRRATHK